MKKNNKRRPTKGKGYPQRDKRWSSERKDEEQPKDNGRNDISWYSKNPNLLVAAGSFPYPYRPGMSLPLSGTFDVSTLFNKQVPKFSRSQPIPGVMVMEWMPSIGKSNTATDPASILGKEVYARVRQVYSGALSVDAPDFVMYLMAMDSIFSYIAWLKRLYRCISAWSPENYAIPDYLLYGMGFSMQEIQVLRTSKMALWQSINELVLQSRKFTVPATMDLFNRHYWMSDNVYTDDANINSQLYMFNLHAVYKYAEQAMPSGDNASGLQMTPMPTCSRPTASGVPVGITVQTLYDFGRDLIDALVAWDEAYEINGYLRRAFEGDATFIVDELPQMQPFNPVYEPEVLMQIENSRTLPAGNKVTALSGFNVSQDVLTNAVISNPKYTVSMTVATGNGEIEGQGYLINPTLSIRSASPTVADSVVASRLQACVSVTTQALTANVSVECGTEVPLLWRFATVINGAQNNYWQLFVLPQVPVVGIDWTDVTTANGKFMLSNMNLWLQVEQYDWHPFVFFTYYQYQTSGSTDTSFSNVSIIGDTHNITVISPDDLRNLHKICIYSEMNSFGLI